MSIGIAQFPDDAQTLDDLLEYADADMYRAKRRRAAHAATLTASTE